MKAVIAPGPQQVGGEIRAQPSKNYTTRYALAAGLAVGKSRVIRAAASEDAQAMRGALERLGVRLHPVAMGKSEDSSSFEVEGVAGNPRLVGQDAVNVGNAGAVLRLMLAVGALLPEVTFATNHTESLGRRPNGDLLDALEQLGCKTESRNGCLPITLRGGKLHGGKVHVSGARSSQFLSGLLFLAPLIGEEVRIEVTDSLVSKAPVRQTLEVLAAAGIEVSSSDDLMSHAIQPQAYRAGEFRINGDWPGSAALLAIAATNSKAAVTVDGLLQDNQGERVSVDVLAQMGANTCTSPATVSVRRNVELQATEFDGDLATDAVLALVGAACFARGKSRFYNVANLRIKECDRISEPLRELRKIGVKCWEGNEVGDSDPDSIIIEGNPGGYEGGVEVDGRKDHRVIMLLAHVGMNCCRGLTIDGAEHVAKSYPRFFEDLKTLGAKVELQSK